MEDAEIAGRTVAAAKDGGLVLSKGHRGRSRPDRMTGFQHGGAIEGAMAMFGKDPEDPTHHETHR